jgi:hypothetical protein
VNMAASRTQRLATVATPVAYAFVDQSCRR